ncbi:hypothetical protein B296_00025668 [Ensete ventricosum]|uniref:Uncharacterized protein n=1 Tax=Ensete ventricosum TaxID=4639 RepID=A0A426Z133_ENSVE|nr:hypothetical protein B296_00025668 [Ensete ventricosum]
MSKSFSFFIYCLLCNYGCSHNQTSVPVQAKNYDPEGEYVAYWLPELRPLPKERRNFPGQSYIKQIVPLKFGNTHQSTRSCHQREK